ncbi:carbohydrate ABC transporter permease [Amycolatopsis pigmentata]|uniref:Carbohydrate ABC transporter permease n=1 Tax=Amycolatopsis pigmentata TaxID=450801 RepID=A0ABW5FMI8_9PSEU
MNGARLAARPAVAAGPGNASPRPKRRRRPDLLPYLLVAPLAIFIVGLALVPAGFTVVESFFKVDTLDPPTRFTGLGNFRQIFLDPLLRDASVNTLVYVLIGTALSTLLGIAMAVTLQHRFAGRSALIAILILPWALPGVVEGIVWTGIWDANTGLLNSVLTSLHLIDHYHVFLGEHRWLTILLIEIVQVWQMTPLSALLILAALQNIPGDLYEAARLDGCSGLQAFWRVTLPLARPGIAIAMVQAVITTLNVFDQPYVLNGAAPAGSSVMIQTYLVSFQNLNFGEGYALSLLVTIATLVLSLGVVKLVYRPVEF